MRLKYAGIGSRDITPEITLLMRRLGKHLAELNMVLRSGGALGSDTAFYEGAVRAVGYVPALTEIYLGWNGMGGHVHDPENGFYDSTRYPTVEEAMNIAERIRGGFHGLGRGGIALHSRNIFQILGPELNDPVDLVICYAKPVGNRVKGGTNTAYSLAVERNIPIINLYTQKGLDDANLILDARSTDELKTTIETIRNTHVCTKRPTENSADHSQES